MSSGTELVGGRIPGERITTVSAVASSALFTNTETLVMSITAPLVQSRAYRVRFSGCFGRTITGSPVIGRIREDSATGTQLQLGQVDVTTTSGAGFGPMVLEGEYTAGSTGNKTFVVTGTLNGVTGNWRLNAGATQPAWLTVDFIRG